MDTSKKRPSGNRASAKGDVMVVDLRKWQATLKQRGEPDQSVHAVDQWEDQWKNLWRDIAGGEDYESLKEPIWEHDKQLEASGDMLLESIERILAAVGKDVGDMDYAINHLQDKVKRLQEEVGPIQGDQGQLEQGAEDLGAEDMVKRNESAVPKVEAFRKYQAQMLEATRERFKIMRRLNVTYSRSLAKRVRGERGVTPDEFAQQRAFFIKEHEKQLDSIRDEAKVQVQEARHKLEWTMKEERATMKAKLESELAAAEERARALRESLEKTVTEKHNAKVRILEEQLASALDRLEKGDFNLLTNLQSKDEFIESLKEQKAELQQKFDEAEVQEKENFKELKRLRQSIAAITGEKEEAAKLARAAEREKNQAQKRADQLNQELEESRKETHLLEKKLLEDTYELDGLRKTAADLAEALAASKAQLIEIPLLKKRIKETLTSEKHAVELREKVVRKCWVLENEIKQLSQDNTLLVAQVDDLRGQAAKMRQGLYVSELAMKGVAEEVQQRFDHASKDYVLQQTRTLLATRAKELRQEAQNPVRLLPKASLSLTTDNNTDNSEEAIRSRLLFRAAALELEIARIRPKNAPPPVELLPDAQTALDNIPSTSEEEGVHLPLQVVPYDFGAGGKSRRSVRAIVDDVYNFSHAHTPDTPSVDGAGTGAPPRARAAHLQEEEQEVGAAEDKEALDLRGGLPIQVSCSTHTGRPERTRPQSAVLMTRSQQRPQSAVSTARSLRPQPMSLGVKKKTSSSACERPASAMARFTSDAQAHSDPTTDSRSSVVFSADLSPEALAGGGGVRRDDFAPASQRPIWGSTGGGRGGGLGFFATKNKWIKGRPASALARMSLQEAEGGQKEGGKEEWDGGVQRVQQKARKDKGLVDSSKASIYMLLRQQPDAISRAREKCAQRFLQRSLHETVVLPPRNADCSRSDIAVIADKIENKQHLSNSAPDLEAVRARAAGERPKALNLYPAPLWGGGMIHPASDEIKTKNKSDPICTAAPTCSTPAQSRTASTSSNHAILSVGSGAKAGATASDAGARAGADGAQQHVYECMQNITARSEAAATKAVRVRRAGV